MSKYLTAGETATVRVTYIGKWGKSAGKTFNENVTFEVTESGAFQYGNQTSTTVKIYRDGKEPNMRESTLHYYDTRYFDGGLDDLIESVVGELYGGVEHSYTRTA